MTDRPWKRNERAIAARLGGRRVPVTGRARGDQPDIDHPLWAVEAKTRRTLPAWLHDALAQARAAARPGQVPIVVLHQTGQHHADDLVVLRLADFVDLVGDLGPGAAQNSGWSGAPGPKRQPSLAGVSKRLAKIPRR